MHPLDPALGRPWPPELAPLLSDKDAAAPLLADTQDLLPRWVDCQARYAELRTTQPGAGHSR